MNNTHRMRNLAAKVPEDLWPEFKARASAAYQAPSRAIARDLASGVVGAYQTELPVSVRSSRAGGVDLDARRRSTRRNAQESAI